MFFDLNLAVDGVGDQSRREMVAMAMQLGYSGVAANHIFTGVMADSDRCKLRPLDVRSVLAAATGVAEAAKFHREALGVAPGLPFRQFTRITVVVDTLLQANQLNSGNPVLKTYDLVAVRPTNQKSFNHACSQLEVDLISLDASQRLPFRLKLPMVKAAIERGIYFEVSYGRAILDPKARRELFANAQMLQAAAHGRNIIVSSGAQRALELRGPNDAANMSTLFGLPLESAKAAVSRNCKAVLLHGVMRKVTYRAAIHLDYGHVEKNLDPENMFNVPTDWDPLSLGGSSVDFIPMDGSPDAGFMKGSQTHSTVRLMKGNTESSTLAGDVSVAGDVSAALVSPELNITNTTWESFGSVNRAEMYQQEAVIISDKVGGDQELEARKMNSEHSALAESAMGLIFYAESNSLREEGCESFVNPRKENEGPFILSRVGKQTFKDNKKKVEPSVEKSGQNKGKRKKRKR